MSAFSTPAQYTDGYHDNNRPEGHHAQFQVQGGPLNVHWSQYQRTWLSASVFLPTPPFNEPQFKWTARQLLEAPPPPIAVPTVSPQTHQSSQHNLLFATICLLTPSPNPDWLVDYYGNQNQQAAVHFPIQLDPTLEMNNESEAIYATRLYIVTPVLRALYYSCSTRIMCRTEETATDGNVLSRLDMTLSTEVSGRWRRFAIIEFKRPGAIKSDEWLPVIGQRGTLGPGADNICRQLHKYAYVCDTRFVGICDGLTLVLMELGGSRDAWSSGQPLQTTPNGALFRWIFDRQKMKCNLYVWAKQAYNAIMGQ
jgi:hypothetical protein